MTRQINTSRGQISVFDGVQYIKKNPSKSADIKGILSQLRAPESRWEARFAAKHILANADSYDSKLARIAEEIVGGKPLGPQKFENASELNRFVTGLRSGTVLKATFRSHSYRQGPISLNIMEERGYVEKNNARNFLMQCIYTSGSWDNDQNRTVSMTLTEGCNNFDFTELMFPVCETIEIVSRPARKPGDDETACTKMLAENPDMWFEKSIFEQVCADWGLEQEKDRLVYLSSDPTMAEVLEVFWGPQSARDFLTDYVSKFNAAVGV